MRHKTDFLGGLSCDWGEKQLALGEGLERAVDHFGTITNITCVCTLPPLVTCKETK